MSAVVVDVSVVAGWLLVEEADDYTEGVAGAIGEGVEPWAPQLLLWQSSQLLMIAEKKGNHPIGLAEKFLTRLASLPWKWETPSGFLEMEELCQLGRKHGLSAEEAAYLYLAREKKIPLATRSRDLQAAALKEGIEVFGEGER